MGIEHFHGFSRGLSAGSGHFPGKAGACQGLRRKARLRCSGRCNNIMIVI